MNNNNCTNGIESFLKDETNLNRLAKDISEMKEQSTRLLSDLQGLLSEIESKIQLQ